MTVNGIVLLGLGPGNPDLLTRQAAEWLDQLDEVLLCTHLMPFIGLIPHKTRLISTDTLFDKTLSHDRVAELIAQQVLRLGQRPQGVTYAVPGDPLVSDSTCRQIYHAAKEAGIPIKIIHGISLLEPLSQAIGVDHHQSLTLTDALSLVDRPVPSFSCTQPALIFNLDRSTVHQVKQVLLSNYPQTHQIWMVQVAGMPDQKVWQCPLSSVDQETSSDAFTTLYLPALERGNAFQDFQEVVARLRAPDGCPWDREQTHTSLKPFLLEEAYEALEALDNEDIAGLKEELGDVLLQIVLHAQIALESGEFRMSDVLHGISSKLIRRHPHVFADINVDNVDGVIHNWELIKADERKTNGKPEKKGMLDGIPLALPALTQADAIQRRARRVGFDWQDIDPVIQKVYEELDELKEARDQPSRIAEAGDLLFAAVNVIRWLDVDAESALRECNRRFRRRFSYIEQQTQLRGLTLDEMSFEEMDALWNEAKHIPENNQNDNPKPC